MIIYGYRNKEVENGTGIFSCPNCNEQRVFKHVRVIRYFTLFFIQLFPLGKVSEYIQCQICKRNYPMTVISSAVMKSLTVSMKEKSKVNWPNFLIFIGVFGLLFGYVFSLILILFQMDHPDNWAGFWGLVVLCPTPLLVFGVASLLIGLRGKRVDETITNQTGYE